MRGKMFPIVLSGLLLLVGCAGVGIVASSDPETKLSDANYLFKNENRPIPAERLIREAIDIYQERNDTRGLGNAYREYGELLKSDSIERWETVYRRDGFFDRSVTYENRYAKSAEYVTKALEYYSQAEKSFSDSKTYDALSNVYFWMAWSWYLLNDHEKSCVYFDKSKDAYDQNMTLNPNAKPYASPDYGTVPKELEAAKRYVGCS